MKQGSLRKRALAWLLTLVMAVAMIPLMPASAALANAPIDLMGYLVPGDPDYVDMVDDAGSHHVTVTADFAGVDIPLVNLIEGYTLEVTVYRITANQIILSTEPSGWRPIAQAYPAGTTGEAILSAVLTPEIMEDIEGEDPQAVRIRGNEANATFYIHDARLIPPAPRNWSAIVQIGVEGTLVADEGEAVPGARVTLELEARPGYRLTGLVLDGVAHVDYDLGQRRITFEMPDGIYTLDVVVTPTWEAVTDPTREDVIVRSLNYPDYAWINLTTEVFHINTNAGSPLVGFTHRATNLDGDRWRNASAAPAPRNGVNAVFNRATEISFSDTVARDMPSNTAARVINFPPIAARPRANHASTTGRLAPWYAADTWELLPRPNRDTPVTGPAFTQAQETYANNFEWVMGDIENRARIPAPDYRTWREMPVNGFPILYAAGDGSTAIPNPGYGLPERLDRGQRLAIFVRIAPTIVGVGDAAVITPASRTFAVRPAAYRRALNLRINYVTEVIPVRVGQEHSFDGGMTWTTVTARSNLEVAARITARTTADNCVAGNILIRTATNGRRPRTANQVIQPLPRLVITDTPLDILPNGRIDAQALRPFQQDINGTWRNVARPPAGSTTIEGIRLRPTAAFRARAWSGNAASLPGVLHVTMEGNNILAAQVRPAGAGAPVVNITLTPANVTINNTDLTATIEVGGDATGVVTVSAVPVDYSNYIAVAVNGTTITVTGTAPAVGNNDVTASFVLTVTRQGATQDLTVDVNLTALDYDSI